MKPNEWMDFDAWNEEQKFLKSLERVSPDFNTLLGVQKDDVIYTLYDLFEFAQFVEPNADIKYKYKEWIKSRHLTKQK